MFTEIKGLTEECGVFGIWGHKEAASLAYIGLHTLQHRGQEGAGIVVKKEDEKGNSCLHQHRGLGLAAEIFSKDTLEGLRGTAAIGHVRYTTSGGRNEIANVQPFLFRFAESSFSLAHNGNIINAETLKKELEQSGSIFQSSSDTELLAHLITRSKKDTLKEKVKEALNIVKGGFAFVIFTENELIAALDTNGFRPLSIGKIVPAAGVIESENINSSYSNTNNIKNISYVVASETCVFDTIGAEFVRDVCPGEIIIINDNGITIEKYNEDTNLAVCAMEFIYFARPDSNIYGVNVHTARKEMGKTLAKETQALSENLNITPLIFSGANSNSADLVIGVPDSGISSAIGYSEFAGIPYELGLIKNRYVGRTFIQPSKELREQGVRMKLSAVRSIVEGKKVVVIDDSIVRGITSKRIVKLLREAGALEVHFKVASPPLIYPCFYGIDIQTTRELIAFENSVNQIREFISADSLQFLSLEGMINSINLPVEGKYKGLCVAYFNGDYPTGLYDYQKELQKII
ncbi:MAG: amidophosphoribosyltransferase [Defluviitaleaceae bacterium]|nr:amidophosphoribosyltransferase [Defluviitaleaceae bacterium]